MSRRPLALFLAIPTGTIACSAASEKLPGAERFASGSTDSGHDSGAEPVEVHAPVVPEADWTTSVALDGGTFAMGCTRDADWNCYVDEFPVRMVTIRPIVAMTYEVTEGLYADTLGLASPSGTTRHVPVTGITWTDATAFANALSERHSLDPAYTLGDSAHTTTVDTNANGWRLPTEAEWEYMARAGTDASFSGGEDVLQVAWIDENSPFTLQPIGLKTPNDWGLHDLSGNAWEWTGDWLGPYPPEDEVDPEGFPEGTKKVVRGGSVDNHAAYARVSLRRLHRPDGTLPCLTVRLVRTNGPSLRDDSTPPP